MNGQKHECSLCKSERIGRQMRNEFILFICLLCNYEWKEFFDKIEIKEIVK